MAGLGEDTWLSERIGHPVFTVDDPAALAKPRSPATYQARVDVEDVARVAALEAAGMRVVNVSMTLAADPALPLPPGPVQVRPAAHDPAVRDVAERSFRYTRFHLDPDIPNAAANRIKRDWVSSYLDGLRGDELLVAVREERPVGFLCILLRDGVHVIDLIGVAPEAQGIGVGRSLLAALHQRADRVEVGTQLANLPALKFYLRLGYVPARSAYDLHMHSP